MLNLPPFFDLSLRFESSPYDHGYFLASRQALAMPHFVDLNRPIPLAVPPVRRKMVIICGRPARMTPAKAANIRD
jgi:hypothetical protein